MVKKLQILLIIFIFASNCYGQFNERGFSEETLQSDSVSVDSPSKEALKKDYPQYWISAGFPGIPHDVGLNLMGSYMRSNKQIISVRYINNYESHSFPEDDLHIAHELSLLYGITTEFKFFQVSTSAGLGISNQSVSKGDVCCAQTLHVGMPLSARVSVNLPVIGIGIQGNAFVSKKTYYGANIFIELGKLW